jgi:U3 small nucleolar RNA-associated protein 14
MERTIAAVLTDAGLATEEGLTEQEQLAMARLDPEDVRARQAELVRMRSLLFYHERKAKRAAKIKSKACVTQGWAVPRRRLPVA